MRNNVYITDSLPVLTPEEQLSIRKRAKEAQQNIGRLRVNSECKNCYLYCECRDSDFRSERDIRCSNFEYLKAIVLEEI